MAPFAHAENDSQTSWSMEAGARKENNDVSPLMTKSMEACRVPARWRQLFRQLTRTTVRGNVQPPIGQMCLVMTGVAGQDEGQMGVVTRRTKVMVDVTMVHKSGKGTVTKSKHVRSLVFLEPGLVLTQDQNGSVWVQRSTPDWMHEGENGHQRR